jgi:HEAT repeat protein
MAAATLLAAAALVQAAEAKSAVAVPQDEPKLIAVLKSDAGQKEKADACRELGHVGTKAAVPALAALLADDKLSHMARYGLETIADPSVDAVFRDALGKLKGRPLVGVIGSIGVRRDAAAVEAVALFLKSDDDDVVQAAARALGKIGTADAAKAITAALAGVSPANRVAFCEGLFRGAEALAAAGRKADALAAYDRLRTVDAAPHQVKTGSLRGAVLVRGKEGLPLLMEAVRGNDFVLVEAAARIAMEMKDPDVTRAIVAELPKLAADKKILFISVLGKLGDKAALDVLAAAAKAGDKPVRLAAIHAVTEIGTAGAGPIVIQLMTDSDQDIAKAAQDSLAALPGADVDAVVAAMMNQPDSKTRALAIDLVGQRRIASAMPALLKAAEDPDETVRVASFKVIGDVARAAELPAVLNLLAKLKSPQELQIAENALSAICLREARPVAGKIVIVKAVYGDLSGGPTADVTKKVADMIQAGSNTVTASNENFGDPANGVVKNLRVDYTVDGKPATKTAAENETVTLTGTVTSAACADALCAAVPQAPLGPKLVLLRVLRSAGGSKALDVVRAATKDSNAEVKDTALRALCEWPNADVLPDVTTLAKTSTDPKVKVLALRGYIRLVPLQDATAAQKIAGLKDAMSMATRTEEKRLVLAALGGIPTAESLALVTPHLASDDLKEEASLAAVAIAEKLVDSNRAAVADAMQKVIQATKSDRVAKRAETLLRQAGGNAPASAKPAAKTEGKAAAK